MVITSMSPEKTKQLINASLGISVLIALMTLLDLLAGIPFGGQSTLDITFLISAAVVAYLAWESLRELR